ncbi:MAG TPA: collagen-binding domain-containing protein [Vicinamibacterales bacterium]|nr:collagen-binding domain-containing protein [Vicinamibacterales bacterium]
MRLTPYVSRLLPVIALAMAAVASRAQTAVPAVNDFDTLVRNYGAVVFNDASFSNYGDTWGPIAVGGNLSLNGGSIAIQPGLYPAMTDPTLYVNGQLTVTNDVQLNSGYASTPNITGSWTYSNDNQRILQGGPGGGKLMSANSSSPLANNDPRSNPAPANWNWSSIQSTATSLSSTLAATTLSGTISVNTGNQTLTFTPNTTNAGVAVFQLDASLLGSGTYNGQSFSNLQFNMSADQTFAINVINANGKTIFGNGVNFNDPGVADRILWNITGSGSVGLGNGGQFYGSVLAPSMALSNANNTAINGQIVAGSLSYSSAELHYTAFSPTSVLVPEPATYALWAVGLCVAGLAWQWRMRRRLQS